MRIIVQRVHIPLIVALLLAATVVLRPSVAHSASSPSTIAFLRNNNIWIAQADGRGATQLTRDGTGNQSIHGVQVTYAYATWAPNGRRLLAGRFTSTNLPGQPYRQSWGLQTWTPGSAGLAPLTVTVNPQDFSPVWSEDGSQVAYMATSRYDDHAIRYRNSVVSADLSGRVTPVTQFYAHEGCLDASTDPSELTLWNDVGPGGIRQTLIWSAVHRFIIYATECIHTGLTYRDLRTGGTRTIGRFMTEGVLSPDESQLAGVVNGQLVIERPNGAARRVYRAMSGVRLPVWSPDGHSVYFTFRHTLQTLNYHDSNGTLFQFQINRASIARMNVATGRITSLLTQPVHSYADLSTSRDGHWLYATRVTNSDVLYSHLKSVRVMTANLLRQYGPTTDIIRIPLGGGTAQPVLQNAQNVTVSAG